MLDKYKIYKSLSFFLFGFSFFFTLFLSSSFAEDGDILRCYRRKLLNPGIECSLCGSMPDDVIKAQEMKCNSTGGTYNQLACTCVMGPGRCTGMSLQDIETNAESCYASGYFWDDTQCVCLNTVSGDTIDISGNNPNNVIESALFKTSFDGTMQEIPRLIRMIFIILFAVVSVIAVFAGGYGLALMSTAMEEEEKFSNGTKVLKNAVIGFLISVFGIGIVQIISVATGVSTDFFDFKF